MYGFSPARFVPRKEYDLEPYEPLEMPWLMAWFDYYRNRVDQGDIYDLCNQGISTGTLMMSDETADRMYRERTYYRAIRKAQKDLTDEINSQILSELMKELNATAGTRELRPADLMMPAAITDAASITPAKLRLHERLLDKVPSRSTHGFTLRCFGIKV